MGEERFQDSWGNTMKSYWQLVRAACIAVMLVLVPGWSWTQNEIYYDQFDWGYTIGNPGDLNTAFWSGTRQQLKYDSSLSIPPNKGAARFDRTGSSLSLLTTKSLGTDLPTNEYEAYVRIRMTDFDNTPGERNAEIAFRSDGTDGYMVTLDGGNNQVRLRRQGGGYTDLTAPAGHAIDPGDIYYIYFRVEGSGPVNLTVRVSENADFSDPIFDETVAETTWLPTGDRIQLICFAPGNYYLYDFDYFAIGELGFAHSVDSWEREKFTNAPEEPFAFYINDLDSYTVNPTDVTLHSGFSELKIVPLLDGTVRVDFLPGGFPLENESWSVTRTDWPDPDFTVTPGDPLIITGQNWRVDVQHSPLRLMFKKPDGTLLIREDELSWLGTYADNDLRVTFWDYADDDQIYGMGEHSIHSSVGLSRRDKYFYLRNNHEAPSYMMFPFWVSNKGYGLFIDNPSTAWLDFGSGFGTGSSGFIQYYAYHGDLTYYVFFGENMYDVMDQYTQVTGRPTLAPRWTLGNIQSRYGYTSFSMVQEIIDGFRSRHIPLDGMILDLDWFGKETMGNLEFQDDGNWENPETTIADYHSQGIKVIPITEPQISGHSFNAPEMLAQKLVGLEADKTTPYELYNLGWITNSAPVYLTDFTKSETREWWKAKHQKLIQDYGFDGFWQDLNEPEGQPADMEYVGGTANAVRNVMALLMNRTLDEAMKLYRPEARTFIMSRSGFPGMQKYGAGVWSGDVSANWTHLREQLPLATNTGLAGVPYWNSDIGGFNGTPSAELYTRWCQFALFNPIYRPHANHSPREPWAFGPEAEAAVTEVLKLRYRLIPYYYTVAREAYDTGAPMMRPLVMDWPDDEIAQLRDLEYMYGPSLMAAPVVASGATGRAVYLPDATWYDWFTGDRYTGNRTIGYPVTLETFPLFVRSPAIIPLGPDMETSDERPLDEVTLRVYLANDQTIAEGHLYEDDGLSTLYESGVFANTTFVAQSPLASDDITFTINATTGTYAGIPSSRRYMVEFWDVETPTRVVHNGLSMNKSDSMFDFDSSNSGWYYNTSMRKLCVKIEPAALTQQHTFSVFINTTAAENWVNY